MSFSLPNPIPFPPLKSISKMLSCQPVQPHLVTQSDAWEAEKLI